jgi:zinc and cadmium transporter
MTAVGVISLISFTGLFTLALGELALRRTVFAIVGLAVGALFGDAFIHLIPQAFGSGIGEVTAGTAIMTGVLLFFVLEKFLFWRHSHGEDEECRETLSLHDHRPKAIGPLILAADFLHNIVDGVIIGASFLLSKEVGIATTIAVALHEIPQEVADFGLLIHSGWSRNRALLWNFISALSAFLGLFLVLIFGRQIETLVPLAAAFTAGSFIYIAGSDLVPELHKTLSGRRAAFQIIAIVAGFSIMLALVFFE